MIRKRSTLYYLIALDLEGISVAGEDPYIFRSLDDVIEATLVATLATFSSEVKRIGYAKERCSSKKVQALKRLIAKELEAVQL